jgi:hypothetical protein
MSNDGIETDVNSYDIDELFSILRLDPTASDTEIRASASKLSNRMLSKGNKVMAKFFFDIQNHLLEMDRTNMDYNNIGTDDNDGIGSIDDDLDENGNKMAMVKMIDNGIPNRPNMDNVPSKDEQKIQEVDGVRQFFPVGVARGMNNPNQINTTNRTIVVDSKLRPEIFPYNNDNPNAASSSTQFDLTLSNPLKECISIELTSVSIPKTWYNIDSYIGTNVFWVNDIPITIESGYYSPQSLATAISAVAVPPLVNVDYIDYTGKFKFNFINLDPFALDISLVFWDRKGDYVTNTTNCSTLQVANSRIDYNLGYLMGFRGSGEMSYAEITLGVAPNNTGSIISDAVADLEATKNLYVLVEDHNQNRLNSQILPMAQVQREIIIPNAYTPADLSFVCVPNVETPFYYNDKPGVGLTAAQLYAINAIAENKSVNKDRIVGPQQSNMLAVLPVSSYDVEWGKNIVATGSQLMTNKRTYFGPVSLIKLSVKLIDDLGNIVNLHGRDWSFTANAETLYQY